MGSVGDSRMGSRVIIGGFQVLIIEGSGELAAVLKLGSVDNIESFAREMGVKKGRSTIPEDCWRA